MYVYARLFCKAMGFFTMQYTTPTSFLLCPVSTVVVAIGVTSRVFYFGGGGSNEASGRRVGLTFPSFGTCPWVFVARVVV